MAEPLLGHRAYVAEWDAATGELALRSNAPGPAGSLVIEFDGLTLALDAADPQIVNFIDVSDPQSALADGADRSLLRRLIGDEAVDLIAALNRRIERPQRVDSTDGGREQPVPTRIARLATALNSAESPGLLPPEAAVATLEALNSVRLAGLAADIPETQQRLEAAATVLARMPADGLEHLEYRTRISAADACEVAAEVVPSELADGLRLLADQLREREPVLMTSAGRWLARSEPSIVLSPDSLPLMIAEHSPSITRLSNDEFEVRLVDWAERAEGWWVRAFRAEGRVPLAAVPMRTEGADAVAHLLLPQQDGALFELDIVDDPGSVRPSAQLVAFRAAIASGQRAARLERLDRRDAAVHAWQRSSDLYQLAGDPDRARQADAIVLDQRASSLARPTLQVGPTIADHCLPSS